jgi:hypothetical protein
MIDPPVDTNIVTRRSSTNIGLVVDDHRDLSQDVSMWRSTYTDPAWCIELWHAKCYRCGAHFHDSLDADVVVAWGEDHCCGG